MRIQSIVKVLPLLIEQQRPTFIWGPPGIGKSDVVATVATNLDAQLNDVRMNLLDPVDLKGFPVPDTESQIMRWLPAEFLPPMRIKRTAKSGYVENDSKGILFLDEMNSALPATQAAGYQLILNRRIGEYVLPKNWAILAAGNRDGDRGVTHKMPSPLANRLIHIDMDVNVDDWCAWAMANGKAAEVIAYIRFRNNHLHVFDPASNPRAFPSPRSWSFMSDIIAKRDSLTKVELVELARGTIGDGVSGEFISFVESMDKMPSIERILMNPQSEPVPEEPSIKYAVTTTLAMRADENNFGRCLEYLSREPMSVEFQVVFMRDAAKRDAKLANTKAFRDWAIKHASVFM